ncbi:cytochrome c oxidase assembly protein [Candidatus Legionella polyplacis]|uniref:cytochrome c oxidase assembly protein n=1 Tax=Candidatus Legionella polyplacis TaxID=2005262 RepID=UPI000C1F1CE9|nr:cytochrome c oxidase assembly protein [Candidatus Legionella polyplacis]ATW01868.1 cytochrome c oxidase assembly protein [Candidatus Legionella polyplacis]
MKINNKKLLIILILIEILMFGFGFTLIPIYNKFCKTLKINKKNLLKNNFYQKNNEIFLKKKITIEFITNYDNNLPWRFYSKIPKITIYSGQKTKINFYAENNSKKTIYIRAIPNIIPNNSKQFFKKIKCFCFTKQTLSPNQTTEMTLIFYIDVNIPKNINNIILSYTFYKI